MTITDNTARQELLFEAYRNFYRAYERFNRIAWSNSLPDCVIRFHSRKNSRNMAFAQGSFPPQISFNMPRCLYLPESLIWMILGHEMTHIWQYSQGRRGGHGKDFKNEMLRIGIDEKRRMILPDTACNYIFDLNEISPISLYCSLRQISNLGELNQQEFFCMFLKNTHLK